MRKAEVETLETRSEIFNFETCTRKDENREYVMLYAIINDELISRASHLTCQPSILEEQKRPYHVLHTRGVIGGRSAFTELKKVEFRSQLKTWIEIRVKSESLII